MKTLMAVLTLLLLSTMALTGAWMTDTAKAARLRHDSESGLNSEGEIAIGGVAPPAAFSLDALKNLVGERAAAAVIAGMQWIKKPALVEGAPLRPAWARLRTGAVRRAGRRPLASAAGKDVQAPASTPGAAAISFTATR